MRKTIGGVFGSTIWTLIKLIIKLFGVCCFAFFKAIEAAASFLGKIFEKAII